MSCPEERAGLGQWGLMSGGALYSEVQCITGNDYMGHRLDPVDRQTYMKTLPSHNFVCGLFKSLITMQCETN